MNRNITKHLQECAFSKRDSSSYYRELAIMSPNEESHRMLLEMSDQDKELAEMFESLHYNLSGRRCVQRAAYYPRLDGDYRDLLLDRLTEERRGYRDYGGYYRGARHPRLRDAYYQAHTGSNLHTLGLLYLLSLL